LSNYLKLKKYQNLFKKGYIDNDFISLQNIFENLDKIFTVSRINILRYNINIKLFRLLNYICSLKIRKHYTSTIHYWIPLSNSKNIYDHRSKYFLSSRSIKNQINLIRTNSFISSLRLVFSLPNVIFLNGFQRKTSFKEIKKLKNLRNKCLFYEKNEKILSENLKKFFLKNNIKKLICIDDYRIIQTLLEASKPLKIKTVAYQHGRFNDFQLCFKGKTFDEFIVWSNFFKKELIKINENYSQKKIKVLNFRFKNIKLNNNSNNILYLCEQKVPIKEIFKDIMLLCKTSSNKKKIFVRLRVKDDYPKNFLNFLSLQGIKTLKETTLSEAIHNNNIKYLIAYNSTALLEVSLYNVYPIMLIKNNFYSKYYLKKKIIFKLKKIENFEILKKKLDSDIGKSKLKKIKKKIWY